MRHVIVKRYPGRSASQKTRLAEAISQQIVEIAGCAETAVSAAIEEISPEAWAEKVCRPDILYAPHRRYKNPGYNPFD